MEISLGKNFLSELATGLNALAAGLLEKIFGAGLNLSVLGPITLADVATAIFFILLVLLANGGAALLLRQKIKAVDEPEPKKMATARRSCVKQAALSAHLDLRDLFRGHTVVVKTPKRRTAGHP